MPKNDETFVPCLFVGGAECLLRCKNRMSTNEIVRDELVKKKKTRTTFAVVWRTNPAVGAFTRMMQRARPNAFAACVNKPKH